MTVGKIGGSVFCSVEALRKWTERNPTIIASEKKPERGDNVYHTKEREQKSRSCVYCEKEERKLSDVRP